MGVYGTIAVSAAKLAVTNNISPVDAWDQCRPKKVVEEVCPRSAFLGLCEDGHVLNIPSARSGTYLRKYSSNKDKALSIRIFVINKWINPAAPMLKNYQVWALAGGKNGNDHGIIDVVYSLANSNLLL